VTTRAEREGQQLYMHSACRIKNVQLLNWGHSWDQGRHSAVAYPAPAQVEEGREILEEGDRGHAEGDHHTPDPVDPLDWGGHH